jgi:hypothetical protein
MDDFFDQVSRASEVGLYYVALAGALMIPDVAGAMDADDGRATNATYKAWFDTYMGGKYSIGSVTLTGEDCYGLRCAMLHQGRFKPHQGVYDRVIFVEPGPHGITLHMNRLNNVLNIDVRIFVADMVEAARVWLSQVSGTDVFARNYEQSMKRYPNGLPPFIVGLPVIG